MAFFPDDQKHRARRFLNYLEKSRNGKEHQGDKQLPIVSRSESDSLTRSELDAGQKLPVRTSRLGYFGKGLASKPFSPFSSQSSQSDYDRKHVQKPKEDSLPSSQLEDDQEILTSQLQWAGKHAIRKPDKKSQTPSHARLRQMLLITPLRYWVSPIIINSDLLAMSTTMTLRNYQSSKLHRLPEELLVIILEQLEEGDDILALFCLRRVCRLFRRLVHGHPPFQKSCLTQWPSDSGSPRCGPVTPGSGGAEMPPYFSNLFIPEFLTLFRSQMRTKRIFRDLLRRDQTCADCLKHCDLTNLVPGSLAKLCKFRAPGGSKDICLSPCRGCLRFHSSHLFMPSKTASIDANGGMCIGREGYIQLCKHKRFTWADVEKRLTEYPRDLERPVVECRHRSHGHYTILAKFGQYSADTLHLFFLGHMVLRLKQGKLDRSELQTMFKKYRKIGANWAMPDEWPGPMLPEIRTFDRPHCSCISYNTIGEDTQVTDQPSKRPDESDPHIAQLGVSKLRVEACSDHLIKPSARPSGKTSPENVGDDTGENHAICVRTLFHRTIKINQAPAHTRFEIPRVTRRMVPTHDWLHALDPQSYVLDQDEAKHGDFWPGCKDPNCWLYHFRRHGEPCRDESSKLHL